MSNLDRSTETISISMPGWLIEELDRARKNLFRSRSDFVCEAVRKLILGTMDSPSFWETVNQKEGEES